MLLTILENSHDYTADRLLSLLDYFTSTEFSYDGVLRLREDERYEIEDTDHDFTSGSSIEIYANENDYDGLKWHVGALNTVNR